MYYNLHTHIIPERKQENVCPLINLPIEEMYKATLQENNLFNYSIGLHPWDITYGNFQENIDFIEKYANFPTVKAIGECGLDKLCKTDFELQKKAFSSQILISENVRKPLIIHCVKSFDEIIAFKKKHQPGQDWIIHGFRGKPEQATQLIQLGFFLSFGFNYNEETIKNIPVEKILLETDDSDNTIQTVYKKVAATLNITEKRLIRLIEKNVESIFHLQQKMGSTIIKENN